MKGWTHFRRLTLAGAEWIILTLGSSQHFRAKKSLVFLTAFLLVLALLLGGGVLVLLVLGHKIVHVGLGLGELHLVHALASVPVQESLATEHHGELLGHA